MPRSFLTHDEIAAFEQMLANGRRSDNTSLLERHYQHTPGFRHFLNQFVAYSVDVQTAVHAHQYRGPFSLKRHILVKYVTKLIVGAPIDDFLQAISHPLGVYRFREIRDVLAHLYNSTLRVHNIAPERLAMVFPLAFNHSEHFIKNEIKSSLVYEMFKKPVAYEIPLICLSILIADLYCLVKGMGTEGHKYQSAFFITHLFLLAASSVLWMHPYLTDMIYKEHTPRYFTFPTGLPRHRYEKAFDDIFRQLQARTASFEGYVELANYKGISLHSARHALDDPTTYLKPAVLVQSFLIAPVLYSGKYLWNLYNSTELNFPKNLLAGYVFFALYVQHYQRGDFEPFAQNFYCYQDAKKPILDVCTHDYIAHCASAFSAMVAAEVICAAPEIISGIADVSQRVVSTARTCINATHTRATSWVAGVAPYLRRNAAPVSDVDVDVEMGRGEILPRQGLMNT